MGQYRSFDEAQRAADALNSCDKGDSACEKRRAVCEGGAPGTFAATCDAKDRAAGTKETEGTRLLAAARDTLGTAQKSLGEADEQLLSFAKVHIVRERAVPTIASAADRVRSARNRITVLTVENASLSASDTSQESARLHSQRVVAASQAATEAAALARTATTDPANVDAAAEERERRIAGAARAREEEEARTKAARDAAAENARRRAEEAAQQRKDAEAQRAAAQDAARRKLEEQQLDQKANAASTAKQKQELAEQKHTAVLKGAADVDVQLAAALAGVTATLAVSNLPRDQRARAQASEQRLKTLQARTRELRARSDAGMARPPADALAAVLRAELELASLVAEAKAATAGPTAPTASSAAASKEPAPVPSCIVDLSAPGDAAMIAIDGAKPIASPAKVRLSSGRHAFVVTSGPRTSRQSELVVCGRVPSMALRSPK